MAVDPRIALTVKNPLIKSDWQKREEIAGADAAEQRNAMFKTKLDEYQAQAPQRARDQSVKNYDQERKFLVESIPFITDQGSLDQMRAKAVELFGQEADDNIPVEYGDGSWFTNASEKLGVGKEREKYTTSSLVYDDQGNAYQPGSFGGLNPVTLPNGGTLGLAPKDRPEYKREVAEQTTIGRNQGQQATPTSDQERREAQDAINAINELKSFDLGSIYGRGEKYYPDLLRSQKGVDMIAKRDLVVNSLNLLAAGKLKGQGQITENERLMLQKAATILGNQDISPELAMEELERVIPTFEDVIRRGQAGDAQPQQPVAPAQATQAHQDNYPDGTVINQGGNRYKKQNGQWVQL